ncbi:HAMP domain-containing histidine kinase [Marinomonas sp. A79]|uniref:histidine kinase n=1 Tax=Marinomonas vulgaris TaxID=2823372 RepID=A0ABS5H8N6_9GAMM|nr:HAMP domain-containing sensor histidine kinase [Marinomonas vulgaris]MBR7888066.1 HAMP domain-containing histidine kinase [Marinomonas vulgaris]
MATHLKPWLTKYKRWLLYAFIALIILITSAVFGIIVYTSDSSKNNGRRVFESALWNALQLQVQTYRFLNYLERLEPHTQAPRDDAFFEYDLLMSRVDLLRRGEVGELVRNFENGRTTRLLNIINGELELLTFQLSKIEIGDYAYLPDLIERIDNIDQQINEFVTLVNKGSNEYITNQRGVLQHNLDNIKLLSTALLICLIILCFFVLRTVDEFRRSVRQNRGLSSTVQSVYDDKASMLAYIHQEIRSPINAVLSVASALKSTTPRDYAALSKHIEESGYQLLNTIEILSDLALIDANKLILSPSTAPLHNNIEACFALLSNQIARKNLQSIVYIDPLLPNELCLDFNRTKDIIVALLENAITHTPSGSVSLQVRASTLSAAALRTTEDSREVGFLQIAIKDTGLGMPRELQHHLRVNPSLPSQQESPTPSQVGLSLALCHRLIYMMKGEMHFSSSAQKGSEFWVDIPYYVSDASHVSKNVPLICPDHTRVLLIETDAHLASVLSLFLSDANMEVMISKDGGLQEDRECELVIIGNTAKFEREGSDALKHWKKHQCPVLSYHPLAIQHPIGTVTPLQFPLMQSQLNLILMTLFPDDRTNHFSHTVPSTPSTQKANNHD